MNCGNYFFEIQSQKYNGFVIAKIKGIFFCSCYISPTEWGCSVTTQRGAALLEAFGSLDLVLLNRGNKSTFDNGRGRSTIDLTFASPTIARTARWDVSEKDTYSDHKMILFEWSPTQRFQMRKHVERVQKRSWKTSNLDEEMLLYFLEKIEEARGTANQQANL